MFLQMQVASSRRDRADRWSAASTPRGVASSRGDRCGGSFRHRHALMKRGSAQSSMPSSGSSVSFTLLEGGHRTMVERTGGPRADGAWATSTASTEALSRARLFTRPASTHWRVPRKRTAKSKDDGRSGRPCSSCDQGGERARNRFPCRRQPSVQGFVPSRIGRSVGWFVQFVRPSVNNLSRHPWPWASTVLNSGSGPFRRAISRRSGRTAPGSPAPPRGWHRPEARPRRPSSRPRR